MVYELVIAICKERPTEIESKHLETCIALDKTILGLLNIGENSATPHIL